MKDNNEFPFALATIMVRLIAEGFVFMKLWNWMVAPLFQLQPLGVYESFGLIVILNFLKGYKSIEYEAGFTSELIVNALTKELVYSFFFLMLGALISLYL
ncbi:MAG: hypothetical protein AAGI07_03820 [Bacteroidota bacterium]